MLLEKIQSIKPQNALDIGCGCGDIIEFDDYFSQYENFAGRTSKKEYWMSRLREFKGKLNGEKLCANDVINIYCEV